MNRIIMHIDVNNAFLSWSAVYYLINGSKIDIRNTYAVISGDESKRSGVVLAKSMPAKKMGVVSGETLYQARKKCPNLKSYPMNYPFYQQMSYKLFSIIRNYSPDIEIASIDECYLDYTNVYKLYGDHIEFAKKLQNEIYEKLKFTVNIGIAHNKLCAKMASDFSKPNKIHTLFEEEIQEKMWPLDIGDLFGVGKKSAEKLRIMNIKTIGDLAKSDVMRLYPMFKNQSKYLIDIANGLDDTEVDSSVYINKGISNEVTLIKDYDDYKALEPILLSLSEKVGARVRRENKNASVIAVILKDNKFRRRTHQKKLMNPTSSSIEIFNIAKKIMREMWNDEPIRLIGLRLDNLTKDNSEQISLFDKINERKNDTKLDTTIDSLKLKYGDSIIKKAGSIKLPDKKEK